jgi:hypothetical protein
LRNTKSKRNNTLEKVKIEKKQDSHHSGRDNHSQFTFYKGAWFCARDQVSTLIIHTTQGSYSIARIQSNINKHHMIPWNTCYARTYTEPSVLLSVSPSALCIPFIIYKDCYIRVYILWLEFSRSVWQDILKNNLY